MLPPAPHVTYPPGQGQRERKAQDGETVRWKWSEETVRAAREEGGGTLSTKLVLELVLSGSDNSHRIIDIHIPTYTNEVEVELCEDLKFFLQPIARN